ncbi:hypothetical protein BDF20DRAFT_3531 [Mycotypha africana]|uniref:uncharacterized protein n=1 Tax=Mycotypha africana TaxID=64632 RepID=UPI0022FFE879|nr:uncharacterized protein BDF20DRAFT_3531 [Mycotypha africana]KAI8990807.1 hypothetical protein BDF20DRAFT_3531 [Mycotypha africana]
MASKLVGDTLKGTYIEKVNVFQPSESGGIWQCPFCKPAARPVYKLYIPPIDDSEKLNEVKGLIKNHIELHQIDLLRKMSAKEGIDYKEATIDSMKRVRLWITGTIKDRKLYGKDPES